jgi:hypothetical protein
MENIKYKINYNRLFMKLDNHDIEVVETNEYEGYSILKINKNDTEMYITRTDEYDYHHMVESDGHEIIEFKKTQNLDIYTDTLNEVIQTNKISPYQFRILHHNCLSGTLLFCENNEIELNDLIDLDEMIEKTQNLYGNLGRLIEKFKD